MKLKELEKLAVNSKALKAYRPILEEIRSRGIPLRRTNEKHRVGSYTFKPLMRSLRPTKLRKSDQVRDVTPGHIKLPRKKESFMKKLLGRGESVEETTSTLAHELGHAINKKDMPGKRLSDSVSGRSLYSRAKAREAGEKKIPLALKAEENLASRRAMKLLEDSGKYSDKFLNKADKKMVRDYKTYSPKAKIKTFRGKRIPNN